MNWFEQFGWPNAKSTSELDDVDEADISLASLDTAYVIAMQVRQLCQFLLGQVATKPEAADMPSEDYASV